MNLREAEMARTDARLLSVLRSTRPVPQNYGAEFQGP